MLIFTLILFIFIYLAFEFLILVFHFLLSIIKPLDAVIFHIKDWMFLDAKDLGKVFVFSVIVIFVMIVLLRIFENENLN
jgi:hypothetical protein